MDLINGPAGGNVAARIAGTKVRMAGKTMFLPNNDVPFVVQKLTMEQINAIPRDRFAVSMIEPSMPLMSSSGIRKGRQNLSLRKQLRYRLRDQGGVIGFVSRTPPDMVQNETDGSKKYDTIITLLTQAIGVTKTARQSHRIALRNQNGIEPDSGIFYEPIDEDRLSDCILDIIEDYFGAGDTCKIIGKEYKLPAFCVLMHFYFIRIGFLKNKARQPFYLYLLKKVFGNAERFTAKTFNNYANEYKYVEEAFTNVTQLSIDFSKHPTPSGKLQDAFQEIGHVFYKSPYFDELRELRKCMDNWKI